MNMIQQLRTFVQKNRAKKLDKCGNNVRIDRTAHLLGHIEVGDNVTIGARDNFVSTNAMLRINSDVIFAPDVSIYTGDHATDILGYHISEITDEMKKKLGTIEYDKDVIIESGVWVGTRAVILKGVTIGRGSVIAAGTIVTKDVPPYSIVAGVPGKLIRPRFTKEQIIEHERMLISRKRQQR